MLLGSLNRQLAEGRPPSGGPHNWLVEWVDLEAIRLLTQHSSAVVTAVVLFWLIGFVVELLLHEGTIKRCVLLVDEFVLLCLFVYFAYQLFINLL